MQNRLPQQRRLPGDHLVLDEDAHELAHVVAQSVCRDLAQVVDERRVLELPLKDGNPIMHAEIHCLQQAGRIGSFAGTVLYSTLMPCYLCAGAVVQFGIAHVIAGESRTFAGSRAFMEEHGVRVVWEPEPGAQIRERSTLPQPTGFDVPQRLDAFLDAVRWGAKSSADVRALLAPFRSGIELEDYQLDPLVRAVQMPRVNLLIADDVGLGKTIEAGLVVQTRDVAARPRTEARARARSFVAVRSRARPSEPPGVRPPPERSRGGRRWLR